MAFFRPYKFLLSTAIAAFYLFMWGLGNVSAQVPIKPWSPEAEVGIVECWDTIKVLVFTRVANLGQMLPTWVPVRKNDMFVELEGKIVSRFANSPETHMSMDDLPLYHYTHDFTFNVLPDYTPDKRFRNLLAMQIHCAPKEGSGKFEEESEGVDCKPNDTLEQKVIHCEWEAGIAADNKGNICSELNRRGESCGFFTAGHQRKTLFWNFPTMDDWVHAEGLWMWDRGHPPAKTELHPVNFLAVRRHLPAKVDLDNDMYPPVSVFATRVDVFASGDGGALFNNRKEVPDFVLRQPMARKDYNVVIKHLLPSPSKKAALKWQWQWQPGNTYQAIPTVASFPEGDAEHPYPHVKLFYPWKSKGVPNEAVLAHSLFIYWDEGTGVPPEYQIAEYKVTFHKFRLRKPLDMSAFDLRVFAETGGKWCFLNEFAKTDDILQKGWGNRHTYSYKIDKSFTVYAAPQDSFRVHLGGWEADGINQMFGHLLVNPNCKCNCEMKTTLNDALFDFTPVGNHGCMDDHLGEVNKTLYPAKFPIDKPLHIRKAQGNGRFRFDVCPFAVRKLSKLINLDFTVTRVR